MLVHTKPCSHSGKTEFVVDFALYETMLFQLEGFRQAGLQTLTFPVTNHAVVCFDSQGRINVDYDSRPLYFLNFTYICENLKPLIFVLWCLLSNARVSSVHIPIHIIIADQLMVSSVRPAVASPFLGHNRT